MIKEAIRPVWAEINLSNIEYNIRQIKKKVGDKEIIGVVKADAYGHGALTVSKVLLDNGVNRLAVGTLQEAVTLRNAGITCPIIMLGITPAMYADVLLKYNITPVTATFDNASNLSKVAKEANANIEALIAIDTGMGRIGFLPNDESIDEIAKINNLSNFKMIGMFSHFSTADEEDKSYSEEQLATYKAFSAKLKKRGIDVKFTTFANSAAIMEIPASHYDAVRPGIILYGCYPSHEVDKKKLELKPAMSIKANIVHLKQVSSNSSISYGRKFITKKESIIATLPFGYADGYPRLLSNKGNVIVNGMFAPIVGNICMDQCMIDVTDIPGVKLGDEVIVMGSQGGLTITADDLADKIGTISYEIICGFAQRLPKIYVR